MEEQLHFPDWLKEFSGGITVCDTEGKIIYMNNKSGRIFASYGGKDLVGSSLFKCHPSPAKEKLKDMMDKQITNSYTIEKNGIQKLIYQAPWYKNGQYMGFIELSLELPSELPHFKRG